MRYSLLLQEKPPTPIRLYAYADIFAQDPLQTIIGDPVGGGHCRFIDIEGARQRRPALAALADRDHE